MKAALRALVTSSGWPPGTTPRPMPLVIVGRPRPSTRRRAASSAPSAHTSVPSTRTGRALDPSSRATSVSTSPSGSVRCRGPTVGRAMVERAKNSSIGTSTKTGPRCEEPARVNASSRPGATSAAVCRVRADFVTEARIGGWSSSCSDPEPHRLAGARPPTTTSGDPLNWAWVMALTPFVTPGPAVSTARPGERVSLPMASAAKVAVCSCRTSISRIGGSAVTAPSYIGNTWAPESVNIVSTPCARATATACWPECASTGAPSVEEVWSGWSGACVMVARLAPVRAQVPGTGRGTRAAVGSRSRPAHLG